MLSPPVPVVLAPALSLEEGVISSAAEGAAAAGRVAGVAPGGPAAGITGAPTRREAITVSGVKT